MARLAQARTAYDEATGTLWVSAAGKADLEARVRVEAAPLLLPRATAPKAPAQVPNPEE